MTREQIDVEAELLAKIYSMILSWEEKENADGGDFGDITRSVDETAAKLVDA
jgi:hypothetical protein